MVNGLCSEFASRRQSRPYAAGSASSEGLLRATGFPLRFRPSASDLHRQTAQPSSQSPSPAWRFLPRFSLVRREAPAFEPSYMRALARTSPLKWAFGRPPCRSPLKGPASAFRRSFGASRSRCGGSCGSERVGGYLAGSWNGSLGLRLAPDRDTYRELGPLTLGRTVCHGSMGAVVVHWPFQAIGWSATRPAAGTINVYVLTFMGLVRKLILWDYSMSMNT